MKEPSTSEIRMYSFIQKTVTEYLILARTEPGAEYTEVIPALAKLIACSGMPWRV